MFLVGRSEDVRHSVVTTISLLIIALLSPDSPLQTGCVCVRVPVWVYVRGLLFFPLHALLADNLITTFSDTLTYRSKIALRNAARFWQGAGLWDVCVGRDFLSFFFLPALFFTLSSIVSYLRRRCHREEERKWIEEGEKTVKFVANMKKNVFLLWASS